MKKLLSMLLVLSFLAPSVLICLETEAVVPNAVENKTVPSKYSSDAFCFSFEDPTDFDDENLPIAYLYENCAVEKRYMPGAGGSSAALRIRTESTATTNGIVNNGVKNLYLTPGKTYRLSAWIKLLCNDIYKVEPNLNFFIMNAGTQLYEDEACTIPAETNTGYYNLIKITGTDIGFKQEGNTISGDWKWAETTFTMPNQLGTYFVRQDRPVSCSMFLRIGSNEHSIKTLSDYTDEFLTSITDQDGNIDPDGFYCEYAIDDWSLAPYTEKAGVVEDAAISNRFENSAWTSSAGIRWTNTASKAEIDPVTGSGAPGSSSALKLTYTGNQSGYLELSAFFDSNASMIHNRAYKISFWAKASDALVTYFEEKPNYFRLIPERTSENRLERTKGKWTETLLSKKLSQSFSLFEIIWYEPNETMLGRDTENDASVRLDFRVFGLPSSTDVKTQIINGEEVAYVYAYEDETGNTVYAGFEDFQVWFDDVSVVPMDIVLNGDMRFATPEDVTTLSTWDDVCFAPGENTQLPNIFNAGTITADASFSSASGTDLENVLKLTKADPPPSQHVDVQNSTYYKLSFWAKADTPESENIGIVPTFDRSITGPVRDSAVTEVNTEGRLGYGNETGVQGDIPYYMYRGTPYPHRHTELTVNEGESLVYDDYFARMNATDGYQGQEPTAWNYQYYDGSVWRGSNSDVLPQVDETFCLSETWKQYECIYRWDYEGDHYRLPKLKFMTTAPADFSLANISIQRINKTEDEIKIENVHVTNSDANLYVGNFITVDYDFKAITEGVKEGNSVLKVLAGDEDGNFAVIDMIYCSSNGKTRLEIPDALLGKRPGIEILPMTTEQNAGAIYRVDFTNRVVGKVCSTLSISSETVEYAISSVFIPEFPQDAVCAYLAFYNQNNQLQKTIAIPVSAQTKETVLHGTIPLDGAFKTKLFIYEDITALHPCCDSKTAVSFSANNNAFSRQDTITVAFLGGSPMSGKGLYDPESTSYRAYVTEYFADKYPDKTIHIINAFKDNTGTVDGRTLAEEAATACPDVVFIDFCADDDGTDVRSELTEMITLLCTSEKVPYIIFLYAADQNYSNLSRYYKLIAESFSIPEIDLSDALRSHLNGEDAVSEGYLYDEVHPSAEGHIVYADAIIRALETNTCYHRPKRN